MISLLFGGNGGITKSKLRKMTFRSKYSDFFCFNAYAEEEQMYLNTDDTVGFIWECSPLIYASEKTFSSLEGLFQTGIPEKSILQFILYADPDISSIINSYKYSKDYSDNPIIEKIIDANYEMFKKYTNGIDKMQDIPVRNFRLFIALKIPAEKQNHKTLTDIRDIVFETLKGADLQPRNFPPQALIEMLFKLFNEEPDEYIGNISEAEKDIIPTYKTSNSNISSRYRYDDTVPIRKQIITSETKITAGWDSISVGEKIFRCITPKKLPVEINALTMNILSGDIWGPKCDSNQITNPFILTVNYIFENLKSKLHAKCSFTLQQQAVGSLAPSLIRKQEEYLTATGEIERGTPFIRVMPIFWHWSKDKQKSSENTARVKRIWESRGFVTQEDKGILNILFISALPFGLINAKNNISFMERDFILDGPCAARFMPIQADFSGVSNPVDLYVGRKGQIASMNLFDKNVNNQNAFIAAGSGGGKSFSMNSMIFNNHASGAWIRVIDIGGSYKKICTLLEGKFIEFSKDSNIILNPFSNIEDIDEDQNIIAAVICQMVYSSSMESPSETKWTLIKLAIRYTFEKHGQDGNIDHVYEFLKNYTHENISINDEAREIAFNLQDFITTGVYGKWFNGKSNLNISNDKFVVLELEDLKAQTELFKVVMLQLINDITNNLYRSDRSKKKMVIFDESWQFFGNSGGNDGSMMEAVIEGGYRKARKYNGSFITIFQSLLDLQKFGGVGRVIKANSSFKFMLESEDFTTALKEGIIEYDDFILSILKSVKTAKGKYSEIFMQTPYGIGVLRLLANPFSYLAFTSDSEDNKKIDNLRFSKGLSYAEAITELVSQS